MSNQDWKLQAILEGHCFYGPPLIYVGPGETTQYPLMFKPIAECVTLVREKRLSAFIRSAATHKTVPTLQETD